MSIKTTALLSTEEFNFLSEVLNTQNHFHGLNQLTPMDPYPVSSSCIPHLPLTSGTTSSKTSTGSKKKNRHCRTSACSEKAEAFGYCKRHAESKSCEVPGCTKRKQSDNKCYAHGGRKHCSVPNCTKGVQKRGVCIQHGASDICSIQFCSRKVRRKQMCGYHAKQNRPNASSKI